MKALRFSVITQDAPHSIHLFFSRCYSDEIPISDQKALHANNRFSPGTISSVCPGCPSAGAEQRRTGLSR